MPRINKIWFRKDTGWWMVTPAGKKVRLAEGRQSRSEAERRFHELKAITPQAPEHASARAADVIEAFLDWSECQLSPETHRNHRWSGQMFADHAGFMAASAIRPIHLTRWIEKKSWGPTTERNARRSIFRAFNWAAEQGVLPTNPLKGMKCPRAKARERAMTDQEFRTLLRHSDRDFKVLLFSLRETGARPKEIRTLLWSCVTKDRWILPQYKTARHTGRPRVIFLTKPIRHQSEDSYTTASCDFSLKLNRSPSFGPWNLCCRAGRVMAE